MIIMDKYNKVISRIHSIFTRWLLSYILLLLIPILISSIVYFKGERIIESEVSSANEALLVQVRQAMDYGFENVNQFIFQIGLNSNLKKILFNGQTHLDIDQYLVVEAIKDIIEYKRDCVFAEDVYVYIKSLDKVLTTAGLWEPYSYFKDICQMNTKYGGMSFHEWYEVLNTRHTKEFMLIERTYEGYERKQSVLQIESYPFFSGKEADANIIVTLSNSRFQSIIQGTDYVNDSVGMIIDQDDRIVFSKAPDQENIWAPLYKTLNEKNGLVRRKVSGEEYIITYIASQKSNLKYVALVLSRFFWSKVEYVRRLTVVCVFLCIIIGGIVAYIFTRGNYNPVNRLVHSLEEKFGAFSVKDCNEYRFIQDAMNSTLSENERMNQRLKQQDVVLKQNFIMKLLKGRVEDKDFITDTFSSYGITLKSDRFAVVLFYIKDLNGLFEMGKEGTTEEKLKLVQFIITNVVEELIYQKNQGFMTEIDGMVACLVNFSENGIGEDKTEIMDIAIEAVEYIRNQFKVDLRVSVSGIHETFYGIPECYQEALNVLEYKKTMDNESIIAYDEIKTSGKSYDYPIEMEHKLINAIKSGNYNESAAILDEVFERNFSDQLLSIDLVKCFMFDLVGTMLKTLPELSFVCDSSFMQELNIIERLLKCKKVQDMRYQMNDILMNICTYIQHNRKNRKDELIENVIKYIHANYHDPNFNVSSIAEEFDITAHYLAKLFREHTNEGLSEYVFRVRMEKAKELLKMSELSINGIAVKVGYYQSSVFIRAFKKYEGVTPGAFKEMLAS